MQMGMVFVGHDADGHMVFVGQERRAGEQR